MPADVVEKERTFLKNQALESGKPEAVVEKMVDGRINKFYAENCLVEHKFVKDPDQSVRSVLEKAGRVARFVRFKLGEAIAE
jgi:elongation factor Ts